MGYFCKMKGSFLLFCSVLSFNFCFSQADKPAYRLFDTKGKEVSYKQVLQAALASDVVFFGELHNNPICHWLEYELAKDLFEAAGRRLVFGAEMFEADQQKELDAWFKAGEESADTLLSKIKKWPNFETDYKPVLDFAKGNGVRFIATNCPRRFASSVSKNGQESLNTLTPEELTWICPIPYAVDFELSMYKKMKEMFGDSPHGMNIENFVSAQALKDATMAWFIFKNFPEGGLFFHMNGSFHSERKEGIVWYLKRLKQDIKVLTIHPIEYENLDKIEKEDKVSGDFILVIPTSMTKTY